MNTTDIAPSLAALFGELADGAPPKASYILNPGDVGLLRSLDKLSAAAASQSVHGGGTIAAHVDHLRYGLSMMSRWAKGENPWADADWSASWRISQVSDVEWKRLRTDLAAEVRRWHETLAQPREVKEAELSAIVGSIAHLAYHLGALRQIDRAARGPQ